MENTFPEWAKGLADEDWQFIKRLLLASGSLKDVAEQYGISYPTIRIKLNRLIEKVQILVDGKLDISTAKTLLKTFEENSN
jgi:hypothetical protein